MFVVLAPFVFHKQMQSIATQTDIMNTKILVFLSYISLVSEFKRFFVFLDEEIFVLKSYLAWISPF